MRRTAILIAGLLVLAGGASAADSRKLSVTIYNNDLALVEDVRTETLTAGRQRIEFKDVSPQIKAETVSLSAPGIGIVEQNFDYDLLSPDTLMEKAVGTQVKIVRVNPATGAETVETATVLAVNEGVVLQIGDRIEVLRDDGLPTRVIFDRVPPNLRARPTLSVMVDAAKAGPRQTQLRYLTSGLGWKADYVAMFDEKAGKLDLQGWITLTNTSGTGFEAADVQLVAGEVSQISRPGGRPRPLAGVSAAGTAESDDSFSDYHLYTLPEPTTIAQNQTKQVSFLDVQGAAARKVYRIERGGFDSQAQPVSAQVRLEFSAGSAAVKPKAMPAGVVRVYIRDAAGEPKYIGENEIDHTPAGSELSLVTGDAFDVTLQSTQVAADKVSKTLTRYTMSYVVRNARPEPVVVDVRQSGLGRSGKLVKESQASRRLDADTLAWAVAVPANGETVLTFTVDSGY